MSAPWTPSHTNVTYPPGVGLGTVALTERCNVFVPDGAGPFPVVLWIEDTALTGSAPSRKTTIAAAETIGHKCLANGIAFVSATVARVDAGASGGGLFSVPGSGPWDSSTQLNGWKSAVHLIQWARSQAATYNFNANAIVIGGEQIGADLALFAGAGPAVASTAQFRAGVSHRAQGVIAMRPTAWWPGVLITQPGGIFSESGSPGTAATELGDVSTADLEAASACKFLFAAHETVPLFLWATGARGSDTFEFTSNKPTLTNTLPAAHDAWGAQAIRRQSMGASYAYHLLRSTALQQRRRVDPTSYPTAVLIEDEDVYGHAAQWVRGVAELAPPLDPLRERIVRNLMAAVSAPESGANYWHTVSKVRRGPDVWPDKIPSQFEVWVTGLESETAGYNRDTTAQIHSTLRCDVFGMMKTSSEDAPLRAERLATDLERAINADRTLGGLVTETIVTERAPILAAEGQTPMAGATLSVEIRYRTDPLALLTPR